MHKPTFLGLVRKNIFLVQEFNIKFIFLEGNYM